MRFSARSLAIACLLAGFAIVNALPVAAQTLGFSKAFSPATVEPGEISRLTFTIDNSANSIEVGSLRFIDALPSGLTVTPPGTAVGCGTFAALGSRNSFGQGRVELLGGVVAAGGTCTVSIDVRAARPGTFPDPSGQLTSDLPEATPGASATLTVVAPVAAAEPLGFSKAFSPAMVVRNQISRLTYTIDNSANVIEVGSLAFRDFLPAGLSVAGPGPAVGCGSLSVSTRNQVGSAQVTASGGTVAAGGTCTISLDVQASLTGTLTSTSRELTSDLPEATPGASATLTVVAPVAAAEPLGFSKAFSPAMVVRNQISRLTYTIDNSANVIEVGLLAFRDFLPAGLSVAGPGPTVGCGSLSVSTRNPIGSVQVTASGGTVAAGGTCTISLDVQASLTGTLTNTSRELTSDLPEATPGASATLTVVAPVAAAEPLGFAKAFSPATVDLGGISRLTYTIDNTANLIDVGGLAFDDDFPDGLAVAGTPDAATTCGGTFAPAASATSLVFTGGRVAAGQSCELSVDVVASRAGALTGTSGDLTSDLPGDAPGVEATLTVNEPPLSVSMSFEPLTIRAGGVSRLTYVLRNGAAVGATSVTLFDRLPADVVLAPELNQNNGCGGFLSATPGGGRVSYSRGSLGVDAACTIAVDVTSAAVGRYPNETERVTSTHGDSTPASATLTVNEAPLSVSMSFEPLTIRAGGVSRLTYVLRNGAAVGATSVTLFDRLPADVVLAPELNQNNGCGGFLSSTPGGGRVSYSRGSLGVDAACTIAVDVTSAAVGRYPNETERVTSTHGDSTPASATLTVEPAAAPGFAKAFSPGTVDLGGISRLTYTIDNTANLIDVGGLAFDDDFPDGLAVAGTPDAATTCGGTFAPAASATSLVFTGGRVAAGQSCELSVDVVASRAGALTGASGDLTSDLPGDAPGVEATLTVNEPPLSVSMSFEPLTIRAGGVSRLTYVLRNGAAVGATSVTLFDRLPADVVLAPELNQNNGCGGFLSATPGGGRVSYSRGSLGVDAACTIAVDVTSAAVGRYPNETERVTSTHGDSTPASATLTVNEAPLSVSMSFSPSTIDQGGVSRLTYVLRNGAAVGATSVTLSDRLPAGVVLAPELNAENGCGGFLSSTPGGGRVSYSRGSLGVDAACTIAVDVTSAAVGRYPNDTERVTSTLGDSTPASATLTVEPAAAPGFAKAFSPATVDVGGVSRLTYTIDNTANAIEVGSLAFSDFFPFGVGGLAFRDVLPGLVVADPPNASTTCGGTFAPAASASLLTFSGGSVAAGQTCTLAVDLQALLVGILSSTTSALTSDLSVDAPGASATLTVRPGPLSVSMSFEPPTIGAGGVSRLTYVLRNGALIPATSVTLSDRLPAGVVLAPELNAENGCGGFLSSTLGGRRVSYSHGSLVAGAACTIAVDVTSAAVGRYPNETERVTSTHGDSTPASATLTVEPAAAPGFAKAFSPATVDVGGVSRLTYRIDNTANLLDVGSLAFDDDFPDGLAVAGTPDASTTCGGTFAPAASATSLVFTGGRVAAGQSCELSVDVVASRVGALTGTSGDLTSDLPVDAPGVEATLTVSEVRLSVSMSFSPSTIGAGGVSRLTYVLRNGAAVAATSVVLSDRLPAGVVLAPELNAENGCGGFLSSTLGGRRVSYSHGSLVAGAACTIAVDVTSAAVGRYPNETERVTSTHGDSTPASATLTVNEVRLSVSMSFEPPTIGAGGVSRLTYVLRNGAAVGATSVTLSDRLPADVVLAPELNAENGCGGFLSATPGGGRVSYSRGSLGVDAACTIAVDVTATAVGSYPNDTERVTSSLGASTAASATLTVNEAEPPLSVSMSFSPSTIGQGGVSRLTYVLDNGAAVAAAEVALFDRLPADVVLAPELNADNGCGGFLSATPGGRRVSYSGGSLVAGATCMIAVDVTSAVAERYPNDTERVTSSLGASTAASATLTVTEAEPPLSVSMSFSPSTIGQGGVSRLTYVLDNGAAVAATSVALSDRLPTDVVLAPELNAENGCGGFLSATPGGRRVSYSGGSLVAGATCTIAVDVTATAIGSYPNETERATSSLGASTAASATLTVGAAAAPDFAKAFSAALTVNEAPLSVSMSFEPPTIGQGGVSRLTYGLNNGEPVAATSVALSDTLPTGVVVADPPDAQSTCTGGTVSATAGGGRVSYSGGSLAAAATCTIAVDVTSAAAGSYPNGAESATSSLGTSAAAEAMLTVDPVGAGTVTFNVESDTDGIFEFTSAKRVLTLSLEVDGGTGTRELAVATGSYSVEVAAPTGVALTKITCMGGDSTADVSAAMIFMTVDASEAVTCTLWARSSVQPTVEAINSFLTRRADLILSSESDPHRRFERLNRGSGQASPLRYATGDLEALVPFTVQGGISFTGGQGGNGGFEVSTSLLQVRQAAASAALASGSAGDVAYVENYRFGAWFEAQYKQFGGGSDEHGDFAIAYFGMDYLVKPDVLVGALVSLDTMEEVTDTSTVSGFGYMIGPYVTARLASHLYFDGHVAVGRSDNRISPFNTYTDTFQTRRWLARGSLTGEARHGNWTIRPHARLGYFEETQQRYTDSVGATIPSQTVRLGQLKIGPTFTGRFEGPEGWTWAPYLEVEGIYNIGDTMGVTLTDTNGPEVEGWRARLQAGVGLTTGQGTRLSLGATHDGLGRSDFENWGLKFELSIPFGKP